jgi:hypothetical protein
LHYIILRLTRTQLQPVDYSEQLPEDISKNQPRNGGPQLSDEFDGASDIDDLALSGSSVNEVDETTMTVFTTLAAGSRYSRNLAEDVSAQPSNRSQLDMRELVSVLSSRPAFPEKYKDERGYIPSEEAMARESISLLSLEGTQRPNNITQGSSPLQIRTFTEISFLSELNATVGGQNNGDEGDLFECSTPVF